MNCQTCFFEKTLSFTPRLFLCFNKSCFPYRKITYVRYYNRFFDTKNDLTANTTVLYHKNMMIQSYVGWFLLKKSIIFFEYRYEHKLIRCGMTRRFRKYIKVDFENLWVTSLLHTTRGVCVHLCVFVVVDIPQAQGQVSRVDSLGSYANFQGWSMKKKRPFGAESK